MMIFSGIMLSYLIGSMPSAYIVTKIVKGTDLRDYGSGNVGATNVFRVVGKKWGIAVLLFDILKGFVAVALLSRYFQPSNLSPFLSSLLFGVAAICGHTWTVWLRFRGGKGVATSIGVFLALVPVAFGPALLVWMAIFIWKRYVSLASLCMAASFPLWVLLFYQKADFFWMLFPMSLALAFFIFFTHRDNIRRLREGSENRLI